MRFLIAFLLAAAPAAAQQWCGPRAELVQVLSERYGERVVAAGLSAGIVFEVHANPDTGTWTMAAVQPDGGACVVAVGSDWHTTRAPGRDS